MLARLKTILWKPWGFGNSIPPQEKQWKQPVDIIKNSWLCLCVLGKSTGWKPISNKQTKKVGENRQAQFTSSWDSWNKLINKNLQNFDAIFACWTMAFVKEIRLENTAEIFGMNQAHIWIKTKDQFPYNFTTHFLIFIHSWFLFIQI